MKQRLLACIILALFCLSLSRSAHAMPFSIVSDVAGIWDWLVHFFPNFFKFLETLLVKFLAWAIILFMKFSAYMMYLSWEVAKEIISQMGISEAINAAFAQLDSKFLAISQYFQFPQHINTLVSAYMTRYVMGVLPGTGVS